MRDVVWQVGKLDCPRSTEIASRGRQEAPNPKAVAHQNETWGKPQSQGEVSLCLGTHLYFVQLVGHPGRSHLSEDLGSSPWVEAIGKGEQMSVTVSQEDLETLGDEVCLLGAKTLGMFRERRITDIVTQNFDVPSSIVESILAVYEDPVSKKITNANE